MTTKGQSGTSPQRLTACFESRLNRRRVELWALLLLVVTFQQVIEMIEVRSFLDFVDLFPLLLAECIKMRLLGTLKTSEPY